MLLQHVINTTTKADTALSIQRLVLCGFIATHGWARFFAGGVPPFGTWLESQGFPFGIVIAGAITAFEIGGTLVLAAGRFVPLLCCAYAFIYAVGIVLVHAPAGWFVVGLGRNGMEYSVLLIVCLLSIAYQHWQPKSR